MRLFLLALALCGFATARAAAPQVSGKVVAVEDGKVKIAIESEKPVWAKPNAPVKFTDGMGKIVEVSADGAKPAVITVRTKLSSKMKAGDAVAFDKGKGLQGC